jgi:DNA-binding LacI/PurR family transcriptional regulator
MGLLEKQPGVGAVVKAQQKNGCDMEKIIRIGSNSIFGGSEYYAKPLATGIQKSPYGKHSFFSPITIEEFTAQEYSYLDALLVSRIPSELRPEIIAYKKPVVFLNNFIKAPNIGNIYIDNFAEAKRAVDYLIKYGHQKIAIVGDADLAGNFRVKGYEAALMENNLPILPELYLTDPTFYSVEKIESFVKNNQFTAMFFVNGASFLNTFQVISSLLGDNFNNVQTLIFDDISKMNVFERINAAFVRQPLKEMGALSVEYIRRKICNPEYPVIDKCLKCNLVIK